MKSTTLALLGGLLCAGSALASDPVPPPQPAAAGSSIKIAIDPATGKRRALTAAESAALENAAPAARMARTAVTRKQRIPATEAEAAATAVTVNGITMMKPSQEMLSTITISRDADGKLVYSEDGVPMGQQQEAAHE